ncbi:MAG: MFS transporter [Candidatus Bathyarchaeota archaeon]|nr:MAG: MFS transporter [Candidatus Bathyarchaeota archaeon]
MFVSVVIPPHIIVLYLWVTFYGLSYGGLPEQYAALVADYFQPKDDISLFGYLTFIGALGGALYPLIGGYLRDQTGNYYTSLIFLGIGMLCGVASILPITPQQKQRLK